MQVRIKCNMRRTTNLAFRVKCKLRDFIGRQNNTDYRRIPIIINNFNRLKYLQFQLEWFKEAGYNNIHIIDNASTYKPLLDYYKSLPYTIYRLDANKGPYALWQTHLFLRFRSDYFVYTDPDILPIEDCPFDFLEAFLETMKENPGFSKVGFGLKIDDIPEFYPYKSKVQKWESKFWKKKFSTDFYEAPIDTTFALYPPDGLFSSELPALRSAYPILARHLSWYENHAELDEESKYYSLKATDVSSWTHKTETMYK